MVERPTATSLLRRAAELYDDPSTGLREAASSSWHQGFDSGAQWMALTLRVIRDQPTGGTIALPRGFNSLGCAKYAASLAAPAAGAIAALLMHSIWPIVLAIPAFYLIEVQMLFLFPLALDGCAHPFRDSAILTKRAGGTLRAAGTVMFIAATMLFGGFASRGFVRSWCLGCLAICVWYHLLSQDSPDKDATSR